MKNKYCYFCEKTINSNNTTACCLKCYWELENEVMNNEYDNQPIEVEQDSKITKCRCCGKWTKYDNYIVFNYKDTQHIVCSVKCVNRLNRRFINEY